MNGVWTTKLNDDKNVTLAFVLDLKQETGCRVSLAAASCYKVHVDGTFLAFGPQRGSHGYARVANYRFCGKRVVIEVMYVGVPNFCWVKQQPFFACEIDTDAGVHYEAQDFSCYYLKDRIQRVQRYSYQRGFAEVYRMKQDRSALYSGSGTVCEDRWCPVETVSVSVPRLLPSRVDEPKYVMHKPKVIVEEGSVTLDENAEIWRDGSQTLIGKQLEGYDIGEWDAAPTDEASAFVFHPNTEGKQETSYCYKTYDFGRAITGFTELHVKVETPGKLYVLFDELLWNEVGHGANYVGFSRNNCASVFEWIFEASGDYRISVFEPYTIRYACVVTSEPMDVEIVQRDYENPNVKDMTIPNGDEALNKIIRAAQATLAQNAVDVLTDCPSRERAGWLSDSYFSSEAEWILTGKNQAEMTFLENYALADTTGLPEGMIPMCYPADGYPPRRSFIPNWTMWYILELDKYAQRYGKDEIIAKSYKNVQGILSYFEKKENEFGVLEDLEGWVFVEWSAANDKEHIQGVNVPSNITYAATLKAAERLYGNTVWGAKAKTIETFLKAQAYDGRFFVDNLIRNESGRLIQSGLITEVCQYYAFWFGMITKEEYPELYGELMERLGTNREEGYLPEVATSNVMYGLYMRVDLFMREGAREKVLEECLKLFLPMAERTGTLWEHNSIKASCNHGFASYCLKWITYVLDGR